MSKKIKGKIVTEAPSVGFENLHPRHFRNLRKGTNLPPYGISDGIEDKYIQCVQCGMMFNEYEANEGSGWGNINPTITYPVNTTLDDYSLGGTVSAGASTTSMAVGTVGGRVITPSSNGSLHYIVAYIAPTSATDMVGLVYHLSSGRLLTWARERNIASGAGWAVFSILKPLTINKNEPIVVCLQSEDSAWNLYYTGSGSGKYKTSTYDYYPSNILPSDWTSVDALYSVFISSYSAYGHYDVEASHYQGGSHTSTKPADFVWKNNHAGCPFCGSSNYKGNNSNG